MSFKGEAEAGSGVGCFGIACGGEVFGKVSFSFNKISAGKKKKGLRKLRQNVWKISKSGFRASSF